MRAVYVQACSYTCAHIIVCVWIRRLLFFGSVVVTSATSLLCSVVLLLDLHLCGTAFPASHSSLELAWAKLAHEGNEWEGASRSTCSREPLPTPVLRVCNSGGFSLCLGTNVLRKTPYKIMVLHFEDWNYMFFFFFFMKLCVSLCHWWLYVFALFTWFILLWSVVITRLQKESSVCCLSFHFCFHSYAFACVHACVRVNSDLPLRLKDTALSCLLPAHYRASLLNAQMRLFLFSSHLFKDKEPTETYGSRVTTHTHTHTFKWFLSSLCFHPVCPGDEGNAAQQQSPVCVCVCGWLCARLQSYADVLYLSASASLYTW